jgi:hypothetical protein
MNLLSSSMNYYSFGLHKNRESDSFDKQRRGVTEIAGACANRTGRDIRFSGPPRVAGDWTTEKTFRGSATLAPWSH